MKLTDVSVAGEPIKQSIMVQRLEINFSEETKEFLLKLSQAELKNSTRQIDCTEFMEWLLERVLDEEDWNLNAVSFGEIIARKLTKLGLLEVKNGYYYRYGEEEEND